MINNIFSIFDPSLSLFSISWLTVIFFLLPLNQTPIILNINNHNTIFFLYNQIVNETNQLISNINNISPSLMVNIFFLVIILNLIAIIPFNFTSTAHISISFTISITLWLSVVLFGWVNNFNNIITHLTPTGTPNSLINFIVLIELVSIIIRPITLSVRLSANIVAGHLLISLLSNFSIVSKTNTITAFMVIIILTSLELIVALIQAYVLITLVTLYQNENI